MCLRCRSSRADLFAASSLFIERPLKQEVLVYTSIGDLFCLVGMGYIFFYLPDWAPVPDLFLSTDASGSIGYGVFYSGEWLNGAWSVAQQSLSIACKGLFPIVLSCYVWKGGEWQNRRIQFDCDNKSVE